MKALTLSYSLICGKYRAKMDDDDDDGKKKKKGLHKSLIINEYGNVFNDGKWQRDFSF